jgi:hypothetical protein
MDRALDFLPYIYFPDMVKRSVSECQLEPKHESGNDRRIKHLSLLG